jgi:hypothetical protein
MVVVAGIWEQGWFDFKTELNLWQFPMRELGVDELAMTPVSGMKTSKVREFRSVDELVQHYSLPLIIGTEYGECPLKDFEHPQDALYLFNRTSGGSLPVKANYTLKVETKLDKGMLWGHQAASIILYDRLIKQWQ